MGKIYGYARVSTKGQNEDRQLMALHEVGVLKKNILGTFISDMVLQLLSFVAENERINIKKCQAEGIAAAKAKGIRFGRPSKQLPEIFHDAYYRWKKGQLTATAAAKECTFLLRRINHIVIAERFMVDLRSC